MGRTAERKEGRGRARLWALMALALLVAALLPALMPRGASATSFDDVPADSWYATWVSQASDAGLMTGYGDTGLFGPEDSLTRAQAATVLWRMAGSPSVGSSTFPDVERGSWYDKAVAWCAKVGVVTGYTAGADKGCFRPDRPVTREELATMAYRYAKVAGMDVEGVDPATFHGTTDWQTPDSWAVEALTWSFAAGVLTGVENADGTRSVVPFGTVTRAMAAKEFVVLSGSPSPAKTSHTVTFEANGGSAVASQKVSYGAKASKPADPTCEGYDFAGWYSDEGLTKVYDFNAAVTADVTLYAKWTGKRLTVSFEANGGSAVKSQQVAYGAKATKPADPTREGHAFAGWYAGEGLTQAYDFDTAVTADVTLYAKWDANTYSVTFETDEGTPVASQEVEYGSPATRPEDPVREGYAFAGWFSDEALTQAYDFDAAVTANITLYAKWKGVSPHAILYSDGLLSLQAGDDVDPAHGSVVASWAWDGHSSPWRSEKDRVLSVVVRDRLAAVGDCGSLFFDMANCSSMNLASLDVSNVTNFSRMFFRCSSLTSLNLSDWNVSGATDLSWMFSDCSSLSSSPNLSGWDVSNWDVSNATYFAGMFFGCSSLTSLNLSGWDVSGATSFAAMFAECSSLESLDLSGWDTSSATNLSEMFAGCSSLESLDLSGWDTSSATIIVAMFSGCSSLTAVTVSDTFTLGSELPAGLWYDADGSEYATFPNGVAGTFTKTYSSQALGEDGTPVNVDPASGPTEATTDASVSSTADEPAAPAQPGASATPDAPAAADSSATSDASGSAPADEPAGTSGSSAGEAEDASDVSGAPDGSMTGDAPASADAAAEAPEAPASEAESDSPDGDVLSADGEALTVA